MTFFKRSPLFERLRLAAEGRATRRQTRATTFELGLVAASVAVAIVVTVLVNTGVTAQQSASPVRVTNDAAYVDHLRE